MLNRIIISICIVTLSSCSVYNWLGRPGLLFSYNTDLSNFKTINITDNFVEEDLDKMRIFRPDSTYDSGIFRIYKINCQDDDLIVGIRFIEEENGKSRIGVKRFKYKDKLFYGAMDPKEFRKNRELYEVCKTCFTENFFIPLEKQLDAVK